MEPEGRSLVATKRFHKKGTSLSCLQEYSASTSKKLLNDATEKLSTESYTMRGKQLSPSTSPNSTSWACWNKLISKSSALAAISKAFTKGLIH